MRDERLEVSVTFDERGYIGSAPELRWPVTALSLGGLRRKIEIAMLPDDVRVVLQLDGLAERERHRRRAQAQLLRSLTNDCPRGPMSALGRSGRAAPKEEVRVWC
jgi:hypothetical protein